MVCRNAKGGISAHSVYIRMRAHINICTDALYIARNMNGVKMTFTPSASMHLVFA